MACIILAGGQSSRMGADKALLALPGGHTVLQHLTGRLRRRFSRVLLACGSERRYAGAGADTVLDAQAGAGPLAGVAAGLRASADEVNFVIACDMPGYSQDLMDALLGVAQGPWDVIIASDAGGLHPLFGVYKKSCLPAIEQCLREGRYAMTGFHGGARAKTVPAEQLLGAQDARRALANLNTPEEWREFLADLAQDTAAEKHD